MNVAVLDRYLLTAQNINKCIKVCTEVELVEILGEIEGNIYDLIAEVLLEEKLLIGYLDTLVDTVAECRISAVDTSELDEMMIQGGVFLFHICKVQTGTEVIVGVVLLSALNTELASVIDRGDTRHSVHKGIYERKVSRVYESARKTVHIVVVNEVIEVDIPVYTAVCTGLTIYRVVDLEVVLIVMR